MAGRVVEDIAWYFRTYAFDAFVVGILGMLLYGCICFFCDCQKQSLLNRLKWYMQKHRLCYIGSFFLFSYLYIMLSIVLLSRREEYVNKIELSFWGTGLTTSLNKIFLIENIIMFIPLGILLPICYTKAKHAGYLALIAFAGSLLIETIQYVTKWGRFEIVDLWTNTLGAILGWLIFAAGRLLLRATKRCVSANKENPY